MELTIIVKRLDDGRVGITGDIGDKVLAYGLLEAAKDAVREHIARNQSQIIQPPGGLASIDNGH